MQIKNIHLDSLGTESFDELGFKSAEELNIEISLVIQVRSEIANNSEVNNIK